LIRKEIRIAGFGGQGVVLAAQIVGHAATVYDRGHATLTQSYGPEARGGSCAAEVVISDEPISYPYVLKPQVMVILAQEAYHKYVDDECTGTTVIIDPDLVKIEPAIHLKPLTVPANRMAHELGRAMVANIIVLGFVAAVSDLVSYEAMKKSVLDSVPKGTEELNTKAFDLGYRYGLDHVKHD
jgi:2-oxoglutarate ferredoxin oxidoreductase subunit gamma